MATEQDFLAALEAAPDDEVTRLVYADWLEDQGESARAEFVRVQCELAKLPEGHPRQRKLVVRERRLLGQNATEWLRPVAELVPNKALVAVSGYGKARKVPEDIAAWGVVFRGGVIDELIVPARDLPAEASKLERLPTLRGLGVRDICGNVRLAGELAALPLLSRIEALRFEPTQMYYILPSDFDRIMPSSRGYRNGMGLTVEGLQRIFQSPHLKRLRTLELPYNWLSSEAGAVLAETAELRALRFLDLTGNDIHSGDLRHLGQAEHLAWLQRLVLRDTHVGEEGIPLLRAARFLPSLVELDLSWSRLLVAGAQELFRTVPLEGLKVLKLNRLNAGSMVPTLVRCSGLRNLEQLELSWNRIGDQGARLLAGCSYLSNLKVLRLRRTRFTLAGIEALATSPHLKKLEVLELGSNLISAEQKELRARFGKDFGVF